MSFVAAFPFAVPLTVLARFLRCLPVHTNPSAQYFQPDRLLPNIHRAVHEEVVRTLLPTSLLNLRSGPIPHQPVMRLELLHHLMAIIDQRKSRALASSVLCSEAETRDLIFVGFVELGELLAELVLFDVRAVRVEDVSVNGEQKVSIVVLRSSW